MSNFKGPYLRIETPRTTDGINLKYENGQVAFKETHVPLTALKQFEKENMGRPEHLKHKITKVDPAAFQASQVIKKPVVQPKEEETFEEVIVEEKPKVKRGPKPKAELQ